MRYLAFVTLALLPCASLAWDSNHQKTPAGTAVRVVDERPAVCRECGADEGSLPPIREVIRKKKLSGPRDLVSGEPAGFALPAAPVSVLFGGDFCFLIYVPDDATRLEVVLKTTTPNANVDLYLRHEAEPELTESGSVTADHRATSGMGSETITVVADTKPALRPGFYYVALASMTVNRYPVGTVTATVNSGPRGFVSESLKMRFFTPRLSSRVSQSLRIRNTGAGALKYKLASDKTWLTFSPQSGESGGEWDMLTLTVNPASPTALAEGVHEAQLTISASEDDAGQAEEIKIPVRLDVSPSLAPWVNIVSTYAPASSRTLRLSPGGIGLITGLRLCTNGEEAPEREPQTWLGGSRVFFVDTAGREYEALLLAAAPELLKIYVPPEVPVGRHMIVVDNGAGRFGSNWIDVAPVAPVILTSNRGASGAPAGYILHNSADGAQAEEVAFRCEAALGSCTPEPIDLTRGEDTFFLILFGSGIRGMSHPSAVKATIAGEPAEVYSAEPAGEGPQGLDVVIVRLSPMLAGLGEVNMTLAVDDQTSSSVKLKLTGTCSPPEVSSVMPEAAAVGQTFQNVTLTGRFLRGVTAVEVSPPDGITTGNLRPLTTSLKLRIAVAADAPPGSRELVAVTPSGRSAPVAFRINPKGSAPVIANLEGAGVRVEGGLAVISGSVEFTDPDGDVTFSGSSEGSAKIRVVNDMGSFLGKCTIEAAGPSIHKPGETSGRIDFRLAYGFSRVTISTGQMRIEVALLDAAGNVSNVLTFTSTIFYC